MRMEKSIFTKHYAVLTKRLKCMRKAAGLTTRQLAARLGREQTMIVRIEQGQRRLDVVEFYWYCKALKVDPIKTAVEVMRECVALDTKERKAGHPKA